MSVAGMLPFSGTAKGRKTRPNIVYIIADDLGAYDLGCYGQTKIETPHIDRLAAEGTRFTAAYGGAPICSPSRCALMTGRHMGHASVRDNFALAGGVLGFKGTEHIRRANIANGEPTVASLVQQVGYATGLVGKWHLDGYSPEAVPTNHGFEEFHGWLTQTETTQGYFPTQWYKNTLLQDISGNMDGQKRVYETDICTRQACEFISDHQHEPFFLVVAYNAPHSPYTASSLRQYASKDWGLSEKTYAAMISDLDDGIGAIMQTLKKLEIDEKTIVFFSSDHGPRSEPTSEQTEVVSFFNSKGPLRGFKRDLYEGGIRVPLIVRWPDKIKSGYVDKRPVYHADFLPTAVSLAEGHVPSFIDGVDIFSTVSLGGLKEDRWLYWETYEPSFWQAIRWKQWKAVRPVGKDKVELYDLSSDEGEVRDVSIEYSQISSYLTKLIQHAHVFNREYPIPM